MNEREITGVVHRIQGEAISWAGICPWTQTLCFGTEGGAFAVEPAREGREIERVKVTDDAINDVAFVGDHVGFSSRMEVLIARRASSNALSLEGLSQVYSGGAHGILATSSGSMLAPLGDDGLLIITVDGDELVVGETRHPVVPLNLYRIVSVADGGAEQIYACAARRDGVVVFKFAGNRLTAPPQVHQLGGEDIVDVTSIAIPEHPRATVCLGRDRRLFFFRDVLDAREPAVLTYDGFQGVAYCLLATQGHVFMLTDQEFIRFPHLATRFLRDDQFSEPMDAWVLETDASDAYLAGNEQVLLLRGDGAISYRVNDLVQHFSEPALTNGQTIVGLTWMDRRTPSFTHAEWSLQTNLTMPLGGA